MWREIHVDVRYFHFIEGNNLISSRPAPSKVDLRIYYVFLLKVVYDQKHNHLASEHPCLVFRHDGTVLLFTAAISPRNTERVV